MSKKERKKENKREIEIEREGVGGERERRQRQTDRLKKAGREKGKADGAKLSYEKVEKEL